MKIKIVTTILLILFCLSSCTPNDLFISSFDTKKANIPIGISAEIIKSRIKKDEVFQIEVGFGQLVDHKNAWLKIYAPNFAIISADGSRFEEKYIFQYSDFDNQKYGTFSDENKNLRFLHVETFSFVYTGTSDDFVGVIDFVIHISENGELVEVQPGYSYSGSSVSIYYKVHRENIKLTTKRLQVDK